jgi:hypothetical protein
MPWEFSVRADFCVLKESADPYFMLPMSGSMMSPIISKKLQLEEDI